MVKKIDYPGSRVWGIVFCLLLPLIAETVFYRMGEEKLKKNEYFYRGYLKFHRNAPYLILLSLTICIMFIWSWIDNSFTQWLGIDYTPQIHGFEGNTVADLQRKMANKYLDRYFVYVYAVLFSVILYVFIFVFMYIDKDKILKRIITAQVIMYIIAAPFFVLFPVYAVWTTSTNYSEMGYNYSDKVYNGLKVIDPTMHSTIRDINCINNCFPSLHVALPLTVVLVLFFSKEIKFGLLGLPISISIIISTVYLGIHWLIDILGGILFAFLAVYIAFNLDYEMEFPLKLKYVRWKGKDIKLFCRNAV